MFDSYAKFFYANFGKYSLIKDFSLYSMDFLQRSILFMDTMRKRGNEAISMYRDNQSNVLKYEYEIIMDGKDFDRPINYWLAKILPSDEDPATEYHKRPYVVQDPRAGQGPGIGGFKKYSEIGNALKHGHPVYFIGFNSEPIENQTYEDIIHGQVKFYEQVNKLHPDNPKLCAVGNCAAGYLTMFSAMQRPDLFGPILIAGSPLSYWNGQRGRYPMRYNGGLSGGSWTTSFLSDIGGGKFDGTYLILNFNLLSLENFLWSKQYNLYKNIDNDSTRYLQFEKWWGDFIQFNPNEIKWIVDNLFIGNKLTTGNLTTSDGIRLDPREITSPIITFISDGDNISPPAQSAGWIADLYHDTEEIIANGKTIVYCLNNKVGHLAIFTGTNVGKREQQMFVENMDTIDMLPPGLYELILETPNGEEYKGKLNSRYIPRSIEDLKKLGYNNEKDDRAFATVNAASSALDFLYSKFIHPWFKLYDNPLIAEIFKKTRPLRLSYAIFSDSINYPMKFFEPMAKNVQRKRIEINNDNKFWNLQEGYSKFISKCISNFQHLRDNIYEQTFFNLWTNPFVQKFWETDTKKPRYIPSETKFNREYVLENFRKMVEKHTPVKTELEAFMRFVIMLIDQNKSFTDDVAAILIQHARRMEPKLSRSRLYNIIKNQAMVVIYNNENGLLALKKYFATTGDFNELLKNANEVAIQIGGEFSPEIKKYITKIKKVLQSV